jgi:hypothetical protein
MLPPLPGHLEARRLNHYRRPTQLLLRRGAPVLVSTSSQDGATCMECIVAGIAQRRTGRKQELTTRTYMQQSLRSSAAQGSLCL